MKVERVFAGLPEEADKHEKKYVPLFKTIFYKGIMPSEKVLDFPVDCNILTGSVNFRYENIDYFALIVKAHGLPVIEIARNAVNQIGRAQV